MRFLLCSLICCCIAACGKSTEKLFEAQREALQKASQVEQILRQATDSQRQEIERRTASEAQ